MRNFLDGDDYSIINMTAAINTAAVVPGRIAQLGLFSGQGIVSTTVGIEELNKEFRLIPTAPRGTVTETAVNEKRSLRAIRVPHIPKNDYILADSISGVRPFGDDSADATETVASVVNQKLVDLRTEHEATREFHKFGALQGKVLDADGTSTVYDLHAEFGVSRDTVNWDQTSTTGLTAALYEVEKKTQRALNFIPSRGTHVFCGEAYWADLITKPEVKDAYERWQENNFARTQLMTMFAYKGVMFELMLGTVGANPMIPVNEAFSFPLASGIYLERWAPADFIEAVNTIGKEYYAKQETMKFEKGVEIHTQSNPLYIVTKPKALIRLTKSA